MSFVKDMSRPLQLAGYATFLLFFTACATPPPPAATSPHTTSPVPTSISPETPPPAAPGWVESLSPEDPGLLNLARALADARLVSFSGRYAGMEQDAALKSALSQTLIERHGFGLVLLDAPCQGAADLDIYASGAVTSAYAADIVREANLSPQLKTAALADLLVMLRGWNALQPTEPVRITGHSCPSVIEDVDNKPAIFWGLTQPAENMDEKSFSQTLIEGMASQDHAWIVQLSGTEAGPETPVPGWLDQRRLKSSVPTSPEAQSDTIELAEQQQEDTRAEDIIFRHQTLTPASPL